ncbi:hypothetical protein BDZ97DRAFT_1821168 [Flammula alnicola]|nr:hypothetical protein BDZ97DRAFT_1821168 [Flammula alnicola]
MLRIDPVAITGPFLHPLEAARHHSHAETPSKSPRFFLTHVLACSCSSAFLPMTGNRDEAIMLSKRSILNALGFHRFVFCACRSLCLSLLAKRFVCARCSAELPIRIVGTSHGCAAYMHFWKIPGTSDFGRSEMYAVRASKYCNYSPLLDSRTNTAFTLLHISPARQG